MQSSNKILNLNFRISFRKKRQKMNEYSLPFKFKLPTIDQIFQSISHCRNYSESIIKMSVYNVKKKKKKKTKKNNNGEK